MKSLLLLSILALSVGCSTFGLKNKPSVTTTVVPGAKFQEQVEPRYIGDTLSGADIKLVNSLEHVPEKGHKAITRWLDYFQGRGRKHMQKYLSRSTRYLPLMKEILKQEGLPEDLVYLSLIESGFNATAHSHASAVGYWQFIRPTARGYNLKITTFVDERRDPVASTKAAASYLKDLHKSFGNWYLAMAAYNRGSYGVKRSLRRHRAKTFWDIAKKRRLPAETINYVPKFLAAKLIAYNPKRFGFHNVDYQAGISFDSVEIAKPVDLKKLAKIINVSYTEIKRLNPAPKSDYLPVIRKQQTVVRVPKGYGVAAAKVLDKVVGVPPRYIAGNSFRYKVRRGDSLYRIARRYGTTITKLRHENGLRRRSILRIGQRVRIPQRRVRVRRASKRSYNAQNGYYRVRSGDNLSVIAKRFNTTIVQLKRLNGLGRRSLIKPGARLLVKSPSKRKAASTQLASRSKTWKWHRVRRGQNLGYIASRYKTNIRAIKRLNNLRSNLIKIGQRLKVPIKAAKTVHVVRSGETLIHIAKRYNVTLAALRNKNSIANASRIFTGHRILIP